MNTDRALGVLITILVIVFLIIVIMWFARLAGLR